MRSIEELIKEYAPKFCTLEDSLYLSPDIPEKKLNNAINSYARNVEPSSIVALYDDTIFGSAKEGFLLTRAGFYSKGSFEDPFHFTFSSISSIRKEVDNRSKENGHYLSLEIMDGCKDTSKNYLFDGCYGIIDIDEFQKFLEAVNILKEKGEIDEIDKFIIIEDMPDDVKLNYVKAIINMTYSDDGKIDEKELAEIQLLLTQLSFEPHLRHKIRRYIVEPNLDTDFILKELESQLPKGSENAVHISLIKDMIRVHRATRKTEENGKLSNFILDVASKYNIKMEQLEVIEEACKNDQRILDGDMDDEMIVASAKELAAKATAVGVPIAAVYLSGSVVGLSATGITSGLATLGLGGVLGLSSMVSGIGVAVLLGIGAYKGIKWVSGRANREKMSKREFMIQEIILLNQKTISNLAEDINFLGMKIVEQARESQINRKMIEKLGKELTVFGNAFETLKSKGVRLEEILSEAA